MKKVVVYAPVSFITFVAGVAAVMCVRFVSVPAGDPLPIGYLDRGTVTVAVTHLRPIPPPDTPKSKNLEAVEIRRYDPTGEISESRFTPDRVWRFDLELGESIENQLIVLHPHVGDTRKFRVEQQFETSMAIGNEGPHFDLDDWKHYTSPWKAIAEVDENRFLTSRIKEKEASRFPTVTADEIYDAVKKRGGERWWLELSKECSGADGGPCYVSVSRISFRISAMENGKWEEIHRLDFLIPMGC